MVFAVFEVFGVFDVFEVVEVLQVFEGLTYENQQRLHPKLPRA